MDDFGSWVRRHRRRVGYSQEGLATRINADRSYVSRLESGIIRLPHLDTRTRLHEALGTSEEQLWQEIDPHLMTQRHTATIGGRLDQALRDLDDDEQMLVERLVEDVIRVVRAKTVRVGG